MVHRPTPYMLAPGASVSSASTPLRCPGADGPGVKGPWPALDDHLVQPEVSRDEVIRGHRMTTMAANPEHGDPHCQLDYLVRAHVAKGYIASTDMLTRFGPGSDFAPDTCVRQAGIDAKTGKRYLEELAFEVVNEQPLTGPKGVTTQAEEMMARGVRRVFAIFVKTGEVKEWRGAWVLVPLDSTIEDPTLVRSLLCRAILDAAAADDAVVGALDAKGNRAIRQIRQDERQVGHKAGVQEGHKAGVQEGHKAGVQAGHKAGVQAGHKAGVQDGLNEGRLAQAREMLLDLIEYSGFALTEDITHRVATCQDLATLKGWTRQAARAATPQDIFSL